MDMQTHDKRRYMNFPRTSPRPKKILISMFDDVSNMKMTVENQCMTSGVPTKVIRHSGYADSHHDDCLSPEEARHDDKMDGRGRELYTTKEQHRSDHTCSMNQSATLSLTSSCGTEQMEWTFGSLSGLYIGPLLEGDIPHGLGVICFMNGDKYEGPLDHGEMHGSDGILIESDGSIYRGEFCHNLRHGLAEYTTLCRRYVGEFENGKPHGEGTQFYLDGSIDFEGNWELGEPVLDVDSNTEELRVLFEELLDRDEWEEGFNVAESGRASRRTIIKQLSQQYVSVILEDESYAGYNVEQVASY